MQSKTQRAQDQSTRRWELAGRQKIGMSQTGTAGKARTQAKTQIRSLKKGMT